MSELKVPCHRAFRHERFAAHWTGGLASMHGSVPAECRVRKELHVTYRTAERPRGGS